MGQIHDDISTIDINDLRVNNVKRITNFIKFTFKLYILTCVVATNVYMVHLAQPKKVCIQPTFEQKYNKVEIQRLAKNWANFYGIPEAILQGVIQAESDHSILATSNKQAIGVAQMLPTTFLYLMRDEIKSRGANERNPSDCIQAAAKYLSQLKRDYKTWNAALSVYNSGVPDQRYAESREYVKKVLVVADYY